MASASRSLRVAVLAVLAVGCSGSTGGATVMLDLLPTFFEFSDNPSGLSGAEVCVTRPEPGECVTSDAEGYVTLEVPAESDVLIRITREDVFPLLLPLRTERDAIVLDFPVYPVGVVNVVAATLETEPDPAAGHLTTAATPSMAENQGETYELLNLQGQPLDANVFYTGDDRIPDPRRTDTPSNGWGGFVNVAPGEYLVETAFNDRCLPSRGWPGTAADGSFALRFPIEAGAVTGVQWIGCRAE